MIFSAPVTGSSLSVVLPALNEAEILEVTVESVMNALDPSGIAYEILIIDDGSTDDTFAVASKLHARHPTRVRCIRHDTNRGYGAALRTGMREAKGKYISFLDADNQFDPRDFPRLLELMKENDMVTGIRTHRSDNVFRMALSQSYNTYARAVLGVPFQDINCAFKIMERRILEQISLESDHYCFSAELLAKAKHAGFRIAETPVRHSLRQTGKSKVDLSHIMKTFYELLHIRRMLRSKGASLPVSQRSITSDLKHSLPTPVDASR